MKVYIVLVWKTKESPCSVKGVYKREKDAQDYADRAFNNGDGVWWVNVIEREVK